MIVSYDRTSIKNATIIEFTLKEEKCMSKELNNTVLYSLDSKGKVREWKASTDLLEDDKGYLTITIEHGQQGGKKQLKSI